MLHLLIAEHENSNSNSNSSMRAVLHLQDSFRRFRCFWKQRKQRKACFSLFSGRVCLPPARSSFIIIIVIIVIIIIIIIMNMNIVITVVNIITISIIRNISITVINIIVIIITTTVIIISSSIMVIIISSSSSSSSSIRSITIIVPLFSRARQSRTIWRRVAAMSKSLGLPDQASSM